MSNPHLRSGMDDNPMARSVRTQLGFALLELGEREEALALLNGTLARAVDYVDRGGERPSIPLEIAAVHAALGNRELSLAWLDRAYDAGIREHRFIRIDPMFASLRESEAFQKRLERMAKDVAVKLDNARELGLLDELDRIMGAAGSG